MAKRKVIKDYKKIRNQMKLTQAEFLGRLGVMQSSGSRYESKKAAVPESLAMLADIIYIQGHPADAADYSF